MAVSQNVTWRAVGVLTVLCAGAALFGVRSITASATDADGYAFAGSATVTGNALLPTPTNSSYSIDNSTTCMTEGPFQGYVDVSQNEKGACLGVTGSGSLSLYSGCTTGTLTAAWQLTEPSGDSASFVGSGVVVGGVLVVAAPALGADGYRDPAASGPAGSGTSVGLLIPKGVCASPGVTSLTLDANVVGEY